MSLKSLEVWEHEVLNMCLQNEVSSPVVASDIPLEHLFAVLCTLLCTFSTSLVLSHQDSQE